MAIEFNVDAALQKLGDLVAKHGPDAVNLAAQVVQVNAIGHLVTGALAAGIAVALAFTSKMLFNSWRRDDAAWNAWLDERSGRRDAPNDGMANLTGSIVTGMLAVPAGVVAITCLGDVWSWVALSNPKLALAREVLARLAEAAS